MRAKASKTKRIGSELRLSKVLQDATIFSIIFCAIVTGTLYYNPEMWLQDYPPEIGAAIGPKSHEANIQALITGIPLLVFMLLFPLYSCLKISKRIGGRISFWAAFINTLAILLILNLVDLFIIDTWFVYLTPKAWIIPGTEELMARHNTFTFHLKAALKGISLSIIMSLILAAIATKVRVRIANKTNDPIPK